MFRKAERSKAKLRLALCGTSGSGKTKSSLLIAKGIGDKIAFIDTENGSGDLYSNLFDYDIMKLKTYSPDKYIEGIKSAEKLGYDVLIIDSLSHAWAGDGGILSMLENTSKSSPSANSFASWRHVTPHHNALVEAILKSNLHIIVTMRCKTAYEMQTNERGKLQPIKIGLAPIQREGLEYEFTVVLNLSTEDHIATSSKDRTGIFNGNFEVPTIETGIKLKEWLNNGISEEEQNEIYLEEAIALLSLTKDENELKACFASLWVDYKDNGNIKIKIKEKYDELKEKYKIFNEEPPI